MTAQPPQAQKFHLRFLGGWAVISAGAVGRLGSLFRSSGAVGRLRSRLLTLVLRGGFLGLILGGGLLGVFIGRAPLGLLR